MSNQKTISQIKEKINADTYSRKGDVITVRRQFFYTHGLKTQDFIDDIKRVFSNANILDSGQRFVPFNGGSSVAKSSHWFVKFTV